MVLTLAVTTSTHRGGVALLDGERLLEKLFYEGSEGHAEILFDRIDRTLAKAGRGRADLGLIACDIGPGSFTGVRVGVAAMQGAAKGLGIPVVGISSLDAMTLAARALGHDRVLAMLDAKKSEVFFALATPDTHTEPSHVAISALSEVLRLRDEHRAVVVGEVAATLDGWVARLDPTTDLPDPEFVARAALRVQSPPLDALLVPLYVRAPDAKPSFG